jgi:hypothetical protein
MTLRDGSLFINIPHWLLRASVHEIVRMSSAFFWLADTFFVNRARGWRGRRRTRSGADLLGWAFGENAWRRPSPFVHHGCLG